MLELAAHSGSEPIASQELAQRQAIPVKYLNQLLISLRAAGLVKSVRGARGGFLLGRSPNEISLLNIVEVLEGPLVLADCVAASGVCSRQDNCAAQWLWEEMGRRAAQYLRGISLADLLAQDRKLRLASGPKLAKS